LAGCAAGAGGVAGVRKAPVRDWEACRSQGRRAPHRHREDAPGGDVADLLLKVLGETLEHEGCEAIRILRDQDDPDRVAGLTQWSERHNYVDYLAWRTERGFTETFEAMLTKPQV
jgi:quinol monooxygenase YgiN